MGARGRGQRPGPLTGGHADRYRADRDAPGRRLFVGVPLPREAASEIEAIVEDVRGMPLAPGARDVRWVRLDGLHLTLRFLGPTLPDRIGPTMEAVARAARSAVGPFDVELAGAGSFPPGRRPRTLWIGLSAGLEPLADLARSTQDALLDAGWPPEERPFRPHLTVARSDGVAAGALVADRLADAMGDRRIRCTIDKLGLFESITGGGPARYVPVALVGLGASPGAEDDVYHQRAPDLSEEEIRIDS
ncbi:MAG TPA: RNA 2',3'-cyclic phosphodiesterase [Candidatus Limnocylindrales bacterium]|nr:RNA 2',3'-cyclic phosphodiesterase [Candidatus Limnocylindrales bacterium]